MIKINVNIPYNFTARDYQKPFLHEVRAAIEGRSHKRYFYQIWHRRSGKDKVNIASVVPRRLMQDPCLVKYVYPTLVMGRENLWDGIGADGFRYREHIPSEMRKGIPNETTMKIPIFNGSLFQIGGSDHPDSLRGGNPRLLVFSEWAEQDPYVWDVVQPILRENKGIGIFNTTPKGDNHARALFEYAKNHEDWYVQTLTVDDTGIFTPQEMEKITNDAIKLFEASGRSVDEAMAYINQEYYCSFEAPVLGSYYGAAVQKAEREDRITRVPYIVGLPVHTAWDLGIDDSMTIWFFQVVNQEFHFIDYYENSGEGLVHYALVLQERKYVYGNHYGPHDVEVRELGTGKSRKEVAKNLGISFTVAPKMGLDEGINAVRTVFSRLWFDRDKCNRGINALKNYKKDWDIKNMVYRKGPMHNWASHGADSFRTFAVAYKRPINRSPTDQSAVGGVKPYFPGMPG